MPDQRYWWRVTLEVGDSVTGQIIESQTTEGSVRTPSWRGHTNVIIRDFRMLLREVWTRVIEGGRDGS